MFIGHYAVAFAAKRAVPKVSLGILMAATALIDLLCAFFLLLGWEQVRVEAGNTAFTPLAFIHYPITHSLLGAAAWSTLFALGYWVYTRYTVGALLVGLVAISHWFLDALVHRPDLPLYPGSPLIGLGLWNFVPATFLTEGLMFVVCLWLYVSSTRPRDRAGSTVLWSFVAIIVLFYCVAALGPPPPNAQTVAYVGLSGWLVPFWTEWFDRHRERL